MDVITLQQTEAFIIIEGIGIAGFKIIS